MRLPRGNANCGGKRGGPILPDTERYSDSVQDNTNRARCMRETKPRKKITERVSERNTQHGEG